MKWLSSFIFFCIGSLISGTELHKRESNVVSDQTIKLINAEKLDFKTDLTEQRNHHEPKHALLVSRSGTYITELFEYKVKNCILNEGDIWILFGQDMLICSDIQSLPKLIQEELVEYSKKYILELFHLPSLKEMSEMNTLSDSQFNSTFFQFLERAQFNPHKASKDGRTYVQKRIMTTPGEGSTVNALVSYFWKTPAFRRLFIDRAFDTLSKTLSLQEYLELELLMDWFHKSFRMLSTDEWSEVKDTFQKHYKHSRFSPKFWKAWNKRRPLEGVKYYG